MRQFFATMKPSINPFVFVRPDSKPCMNLNLIGKTACDKVGISIRMCNTLRYSLGISYWTEGRILTV